MPIDTDHARYGAIAARACKVRDAVEGQEAVHCKREQYLPKLTGQTDSEYSAYLLRTGWFGATGRTHEGMVGMVFRRAPVLEATGLDEITADIDLAGTTLDGLSRCVLSEVMQAARVGVLVEHPTVLDQPTTVAQAQASNLRPYATVYTAEAIVNWRVERVNNAMQPVLIVLAEEAEVIDPADRFKVDCVPQRRELALEDGRYLQRVFQKLKGADGKIAWIQMGGDIVPLRNNAPLDAIPFFVFGPESNSLEEQRPPLQQLADVNFGHYRNSADLEHGAHFAGLPTPWVAGAQIAEGESIAIGSPTAIVFPDPQGKAGFLEFTGTGLGALERRCEVKEQQMASLGARMLAPEKTGVEAGKTLEMRHTGESSVLAGMANLVSAGITAVLQSMAEWAGVKGEITYTLNTDFMPEGLTAQELTALVAAWQSGAISWETMFANLKSGEIIAADVEEADEKGRIDAAGPPLGTMTQQPGQQPGAAGANGQ